MSSTSCQILIKFEFSRHSFFFEKILRYQISWKSVQWEPSCAMRPDRRTDMTKLMVSSRNFEKAPKYVEWHANISLHFFKYSQWEYLKSCDVALLNYTVCYLRTHTANCTATNVPLQVFTHLNCIRSQFPTHRDLFVSTTKSRVVEGTTWDVHVLRSPDFFLGNGSR